MNKREQADDVVESLDELFPDGISADLSTEIYKQDSHRSEGGELGVSVFDSDGNEKQNIEYLRVPGKGAVEAVKLDSGEWAVKRRDKLKHNNEDKL